MKILMMILPFFWFSFLPRVSAGLVSDLQGDILVAQIEVSDFVFIGRIDNVDCEYTIDGEKINKHPWLINFQFIRTMRRRHKDNTVLDSPIYRTLKNYQLKFSLAEVVKGSAEKSLEIEWTDHLDSMCPTSVNINRTRRNRLWMVSYIGEGDARRVHFYSTKLEYFEALED